MNPERIAKLTKEIKEKRLKEKRKKGGPNYEGKEVRYCYGAVERAGRILCFERKLL